MPTEAPRDRNGNPLALGTKVCYHERPCVVTKFDANYPSLCEIDDPEAEQKFIGAKKHERWVRCDEIEAEGAPKEEAVPKKPKQTRPDPRTLGRAALPGQAVLPGLPGLPRADDPPPPAAPSPPTGTPEAFSLLAEHLFRKERIALLEERLHHIAFCAYHGGATVGDMHAALQAILNNACVPLFDNPKYVIPDGEGGQTIDLRPTNDRKCASSSCAWCHPEVK